jgi:hypothetical protein
MDDDHTALKATIWASKIVIGAGLIFLFIELLADLLASPRGCDVPACSNRVGAYSIGLVILLTGAALMLSAVVASRRRPPTESSEPQTPAAGGGGKPQAEGDASVPQTQTKLSVSLETGVPPAAAD